MYRRSACLGLAVSAVLASAGLVRAEQPANNDVTASSLSLQPLYAADQMSRKPLMAAMDKTGMASSMESAGINVGGFVAGGWTYNFDRPDNQTNVGRVFDFEDQDKTLNQVDLFVEKTVDATKGKFDVGFKVEGMWGGDARLIHSNGLNFYGSGNGDVGGQLDGPDEQFDLTQAYVQMAIPVGSGLTLTMGKFVTLLGYEYINPTLNPLYSHSYAFGFAIPFTHTGVLGKYNLNDQMALTLGMTRGWEQSPEDNNGSVDGIGQLSYQVNDKLNFAVTIICGPEQINDGTHYRTVVDVVAAYKLGDNTTIGMNADWGYGLRESNEIGFDGKAASGDWWGTAIYVSHKIDPHFTVNVRGEYFNDDDGCRGLDTTVTGLTAGITITPMPENQWASGLIFRPEIRWDHANDEIFNDADDKDQFTVGGDIIFAF